MKKKLIGTTVGAIAVAPALFNALGWGAVIVCIGIAASCTILIVKQTRKK